MKYLVIIIVLFYSHALYSQTGNKSGNNTTTVPSIEEKIEGTFKNLGNNGETSLDFTKEKTETKKKGNNQTNNKESTEESDEYKVQNDALYVKEYKQKFDVNEPTSVYGQNFLRGQLLDFTSQKSLVPPPAYRIGPGDEIAINIWDGPEEQQTYIVDRDGSIFPQFLGKIYVQGLTFENMQSLLKSRYYSIVPSGSKIDVQLVKVRTIRINVVGEVMNPNAYSISAFGTILNVLAQAGGTTNLGSMRDIQVKRNGKLIYTFDLYDFIENGGSVNENLYLENNDYVVVPIHKKTVQAAGEFIRPMFYQLKSDENLQRLIQLTGGVKANARQTEAEIVRFEFETKKELSVPLNLYLNDPYLDFAMKDMDVITVNPFVGKIGNTVTINGAVKYPGVYELVPGDHLYDLLLKSGNLEADAYLKRAILQRGDSINISNTESLNLENFSENSPANIVLKFGDVVTIFSKSEYASTKFVKILGEVRTPGQYNLYGKMSVKDLIMLAGGLTLNAEYANVEISRVYDTIGPLGYIRTIPSVLYTLNLYPNLEENKSSENFYLDPFDIVMIKKTQNFKLQEIVTISGEVLYPGPYSLDTSTQTISDLIKRSGGLTPLSILDNATFMRDSIGEIYCDFRKAVKHPNSEWDLTLINGDKIIIPTDRKVVSIRGEVVHPLNTFLYPSYSILSDYIDLSGGYTDDADSKNMYISYANGTSYKPKKFLFYRFYPRIKSGAIVYVPKKPERNGFDPLEYSRRALMNMTQLVNGVLAATSSALTSILLYKTITN